jgi:hypothetical protein
MEPSVEVVARIREAAIECARAGPEGLDARLAQLATERDLDRSVMLAGGLALVVSLVPAIRHAKVSLVPAALVSMALAWHSLGTGPTWRLARRLGLRTRAEIDLERSVLKALRGDFAGLAGVDQVIAHARA